MFCYIWEFRVSLSKLDEFVSAYEANGLWSRLFRKAPDYIRTELLRDSRETTRFFAIDYWVDRKAYEQFKHEFRVEFQSLDQACEAYTESEKHIGDFEVQ